MAANELRTPVANTITVAGKTFVFWNDYIARGTFAQDENGEKRKIHGNGYILKDLTVRKAIAATFGLRTFRK